MTKYGCGHETDAIILDDNMLSITAWIDWSETEGLFGDRTKCWGCYCDETMPEV